MSMFSPSFIGSAQAQSCPGSIDIVERLEAGAGEWMGEEARSSRRLLGVNLVEGRLHQDPGDNAQLRPTTEHDGASVWRFSKAIGKHEVWMQCIYEGSSLLLNKRVEPHVQQCAEKWTAAAGSGRRALQVDCQ